MITDCGLGITHNYDYIHYTTFQNTYNKMIKNSVDLQIKIKQQKTAALVNKLNQNMQQTINTQGGGLESRIRYGSKGVTTEYKGIKDYSQFLLGDKDAKGLMNLSVQMFRSTQDINTALNAGSSKKIRGKKGEHLQALKNFLQWFGGTIELVPKAGSDELEIVLTPNDNNKAQTLTISQGENLYDVIKKVPPAKLNIEKNDNAMKGLAGEIGAGMLVALALQNQTEVYQKIENKGKQSLKNSSANLKITDSLKQTIMQKQKQYNSIKKQLAKKGSSTNIDFTSTFDKQGKVDVTIDDSINISAKNYNSNKVTIAKNTSFAAIINLISAYYPQYGWNTKNFHVYINLLAARNGINSLEDKLKATYYKMAKNVMIGYDVDIFCLSFYGVPTFYNAYDMIEDEKFSIFGLKNANFSQNNVFVNEKGKTREQNALSRSNIVWGNIISSTYSLTTYYDRFF